MCMRRSSEGLGKIGVIVGLESKGDQAVLAPLARQIAMHVAAASPLALESSALDPATLERERAVLRDKNAGKPAHVLDKIVESGLKTYYKEVCLTRSGLDPCRAWRQVDRPGGEGAGRCGGSRHQACGLSSGSRSAKASTRRPRNRAKTIRNFARAGGDERFQGKAGLETRHHQAIRRSADRRRGRVRPACADGRPHRQRHRERRLARH